MQSPMVADVRRTSPTQRALSSAMGQFNMQDQPLPLDRGGQIYHRRAPYAPTGTPMDTPVAKSALAGRDPVTGRALAPRERQIPAVTRANRLDAPVNRLIEGQQFPQGSGVALTPQQVEMQGRQPFQMTPETLKAAEDAKKIKDAIDKNPQLESDPSFMDQVKSYFGSRENMLRLAMAFNTMRLEPDAQLTAALSKELEGIRKTSTTSQTQQYVVKWLRENGYEKYVPLAMQDPKMAAEIAKQIAQKELKPDVAPQYSPARIDQDTQQVYVIETDPNTRTTRRINVEDATGLTETQKAKIESDARLNEADFAKAQEKGTEFFQKAQSLDSQIAKYTAALDTLDRGAATGWWNDYFPTFKAATQEFEMIANSLGIDIINSATFGALSESELRLALQTGLPANLSEEETYDLILRKIDAQAKLRDQLYEDALMLSRGNIGFNQFKRERASSRLDEINRQRASGTQGTTQAAPAPVTGSQSGNVIRFDRNGNLIQ